MVTLGQLAMFDVGEGLRPFWRYYGGKWLHALRYPAPRHRTIVEPFAGSAGYALRYARHKVILVEKYAAIAEIWRYLIAVSPAEILALPIVTHVDEIPANTPVAARHLIRQLFAAGVARPQNKLSAGFIRQQEQHPTWSRGFDEIMRARIARQVEMIRHWTIIEGDYTLAPDIEATWFIDPPYNNTAGMKYPWGPKKLDYPLLATWCRARAGQVIVCENEGADWLPFRPFGRFRRGINNTEGSAEAIWLNEWEQSA